MYATTGARSGAAAAGSGLERKPAVPSRVFAGTSLKSAVASRRSDVAAVDATGAKATANASPPQDSSSTKGGVPLHELCAVLKDMISVLRGVSNEYPGIVGSLRDDVGMYGIITIHPCSYVCMCVCIYVCFCIYMYICVNVNEYLGIVGLLWVDVDMYAIPTFIDVFLHSISVYLDTYIHTHSHTHTHTHTHTHIRWGGRTPAASRRGYGRSRSVHHTHACMHACIQTNIRTQTHQTG
jgi:hypothetical protein